MNTQIDTKSVVSDEMASDHPQGRIKLAEAMGWAKCPMRINLGRSEYWQRPNEQLKGAYQSDIPDPFTDANDCNALIKHLNEEGWNLEVVFGRNGKHYVILQQFPTAGKSLKWQGDNWMHGVCELALKALESVPGSDT